MPAIGNNPHTFLHGLSDFWVRFFADYDELNALYQGVEVSLAQVYLDMLSTFLNVSLLEAPIFNTEFFKLVALREDNVRFVEGSNPDQNRYVVAMPDNVAIAGLLQNKVLEPTAVLESSIDYDQDNENYVFKFRADPSGRSGLTVGETVTGSLLTYGTGLFARLYTVNADETPFAAARIGQWVQISESASGNNNTFPIKEVIDPQTVLIGGSFTLPEANNGGLVVKLFETEFVSEPGFANRTVNITLGGAFDDETLRNATSIQSWYFEAPRGIGICKGDILRVLGSTDPLVKDALTTLPADFPITVVRHNALYFGSTTNLLKDVEDVEYVILRESANGTVDEEFTTYSRWGTIKPAVNLYNALLVRSGDDTVLQLPIGSTTVFNTTTDKGRFVDVTFCGDIIWTAQLAADGTLTRTGGVMETPLAVAIEGATLEISGSIYGQNNQYTLKIIDSETVGHIEGAFIPETVTVKLVGVTNSGTYRIKRLIDTRHAVLDLPASCPDLANNTIGWQIHDGYKVQLAHTRIVRGSLVVNGVVGNSYNGGYHIVREDHEYTIDYETGIITQVGRFAGQWGLNPLEMANAEYAWLREIIPVRTTGALTTTTKLAVREVALWAPNAKVDKYHLYNNYGQYINRFAPSSETYRNFIRGIFQLYVLGPTLQHIEAALTVIAGLPVARDDGEYLLAYDATSDPTLKQITTRRIDGTTYTYQFDVFVPIRLDIVNWTLSQPRITFEAFEPFTALFQVTDYVQDPVWWENIIIPQALLPEESSERRTTLPMLYENVIAAIDDPRIGDPGLFIGADDEGRTPPWDMYQLRPIGGNVGDYITAATAILHLESGSFTAADDLDYVRVSNSSAGNNGHHRILAVLSAKDVYVDAPVYDEGSGFLGTGDGVYVTMPAKRRKMANVVMNTFLKQHMFFVSFDPNITELVTPDFVQDLRELVLIAKPGYCLAYIEPASNFVDTMTLAESLVQIHITWDETDGIVIGNSLYIESGTWPIGRVFHQGTIVPGAALLIADGVSIPAPVTIAPYLAGLHITPPVGTVGFYGECRDYILNRYTGLLTPLTVWPVGTYLVDYRPLVVSPSISKNPAVGDTDFLIGGLNPIVGHCQVEFNKDGELQNRGDDVLFVSAESLFIPGLHEGVRITVREPAILPFGVLNVLDACRVRIDNPELASATGLVWSFFSREPYDGRLISYPDGWHFRSPSAVFKHFHKEQHIFIKDATAGGGLNNGYSRILDVFSPSEILLGGTHVTESNLHWRLMGGGNMGIVEQPLQIRVY